MCCGGRIYDIGGIIIQGVCIVSLLLKVPEILKQNVVLWVFLRDIWKDFPTPNFFSRKGLWRASGFPQPTQEAGSGSFYWWIFSLMIMYGVVMWWFYGRWKLNFRRRALQGSSMSPRRVQEFFIKYLAVKDGDYFFSHWNGSIIMINLDKTTTCIVHVFSRTSGCRADEETDPEFYISKCGHLRLLLWRTKCHCKVKKNSG